MVSFGKKLDFKKILVLLLLLFSLAALTCCAPPKTEELQKITLLLDWTPNTNYAGIYSALEEGYFEEEGLTLEVIQSPGSVLQMIATGQAQFGFSYQEEVTFARLEGLQVVSVAAVIQHNSSGFASLKEHNIVTAKDFEGKSYGGWGSPVEEATIKALMEEQGADYKKVHVITTGEINPLLVLEREADFAWIYYGWTGVEAELQGLDLNFIELRKQKAELDYYTPVMVTSESLIEKNPALAEKFMAATSKGYRLAIEDPERAARHLLAHAPELNPELAQASLHWLADKFQDDAPYWGHQELKTWETYSKWLYENNLVTEELAAEKAFTNHFVR